MIIPTTNAISIAQIAALVATSTVYSANPIAEKSNPFGYHFGIGVKNLFITATRISGTNAKICLKTIDLKLNLEQTHFHFHELLVASSAAAVSSANP